MKIDNLDASRYPEPIVRLSLAREAIYLPLTMLGFAERRIVFRLFGSDCGYNVLGRRDAGIRPGTAWQRRQLIGGNRGRAFCATAMSRPPVGFPA